MFSCAICLYTVAHNVGIFFFTPIYGIILTLWLKAWAYRRFFLCWGPGGGGIQWIIDNLLHFPFFICFYLWELPPTLAPAAYSHRSVAKQWPRSCEAPGSKPCRCAMLVPFCGALILITVIYDLRAQVP